MFVGVAAYEVMGPSCDPVVPVVMTQNNITTNNVIKGGDRDGMTQLIKTSSIVQQ